MQRSVCEWGNNHRMAVLTEGVVALAKMCGHYLSECKCQVLTRLAPLRC